MSIFSSTNYFLTNKSIRIEARDDQLLDEGDVLASGIITGDQSPENGAVQNEASILSEQPQSDISASDSVATMSDDQSANNQFARNGGRIIAYEQPTDDSSAGNEGNLFADEPSGTANLLIENAAVDDSFITSSVPSENCDNHGQQSIKSRAQSRSSCDAIHHTIDLEQIGGNEGKQGQEPHPDGLSDIEPKKTPLTRPGKKGRNLDCIKYSLGHIPLGVCGLRDPKMRHVSKFKPGGVTFWRLENPILGMFDPVSSNAELLSESFPNFSILSTQIKSPIEKA